MSLIMVLDDFEFLYELDNKEDEDDDEIKTMTVHGMQPIAFTNELFHAGGENKTEKKWCTIYLHTLLAIMLIFPTEQCLHETKAM
jgi:hypothetical protein